MFDLSDSEILSQSLHLMRPSWVAVTTAVDRVAAIGE